jgi:hypothetical protein
VIHLRQHGVDGHEGDSRSDVQAAEDRDPALDLRRLGRVSAAGLVRVCTGTAPSGAWRASRAPSTPLAIPVTMATPSSEREAWERLKDLALGADPQGFTALDFFTEVTSPGAHARVLARGWPIETPDPRARAS